MRFQSEGTFPVQIIEAVIAEPKFTPPPAFDVCLKVRDEAGHEDWWRGEFSSQYGKGNFADRTQAQITMDVLTEVGYQHGYDLSKIGELVGVVTNATVKASKDGQYFNVRYLGSGGGDAPAALSPQEVASRAAALFGQPAAAAPAPGFKPTAPANPFAPKPAAAGAPAFTNPFAAKH